MNTGIKLHGKLHESPKKCKDTATLKYRSGALIVQEQTHPEVRWEQNQMTFVH